MRRTQVLRTENLTKRFGELVAVNELTLSVEDGEVFGLLGPNGAGKTTTIKMLNTLLPPTSGSASIGGFDVMTKPMQVRRIIGYVPQMLSADGSLTGYENLLIFAKLYDVPKKELEGRARNALQLMGLTEAGERMVRTYSGGMIRRLEIAQSTLHHPKVLFLDEPTIGLDPLARRTVWEMVSKLKEEYGTTIFLTTHFMEEADSLCDRIGIMHRGRLSVLGSPQQLKESIGATDLDEVFIHYTGTDMETSGSIRDIQRERETARRVG